MGRKPVNLTEEIRFEVEDGGIAVITIDRPQARNAINAGVIEGLRLAWQRFAQDDALRVAILTGSGDQAFCAGMDLKQLAATGLRVPPRDMLPVLGDVVRIDKPVIAAVNGAALGAGLGLAAACDILYASDNATFGMPEINVGLAGGASMLRTLFGRSTTRRMFFTGQRLTAADLLRRNVLEDVLPPDQLLPVTMELAREIASKAPLALIYAKRAANMVDVMPQRDAYRFEQEFTMALSKTEDAREARLAFLEKRAPQFKGR